MARFVRMERRCWRDDIHSGLYGLDQFRCLGLTTPLLPFRFLDLFLSLLLARRTRATSVRKRPIWSGSRSMLAISSQKWASARSRRREGNEATFHGRDFFFGVKSDISYTLNLATNSSAVMPLPFPGRLGLRKADSSRRRTFLGVRAAVFIC